MYVHKKCAPSGAELDMDKRVGGFCAFCNQEGTVYHVVGTPDYYESIVAGVLYKYQDGKQYNTRASVRKRLKEQMESRRAQKALDDYNERVPVWEEKEDLVKMIANHMKKSYLTWNREAVSDEEILIDLKTLSRGRLEVSKDMKLSETHEILAKSRKKKGGGKKKQ